MTEHISVPVFHVVLKNIAALEPDEQKDALTGAYENGLITGDELTCAMTYLGLENV